MRALRQDRGDQCRAGLPLLRAGIKIEAVTPQEGYGCIAHRGRPASEARMRRAARDAAAAKWRRRSAQG